MKKLITLVGVACAAICVQAASVTWTNMGMAAVNGDAYAMFAIGANGVTSVSDITTLLNATTPAPGTAWETIRAKALGYGTVASGAANSSAATLNTATLDAGTYQAFMVVFDSDTPAPGQGKYIVLQGAAGYTKTLTAQSTVTGFAGGNLSSPISSASWTSYGVAAPEPTSGILLLIGMAGLALRRRRA